MCGHIHDHHQHCHGCHGCGGMISRRGFVGRSLATAAAVSGFSATSLAEESKPKARVAAVFLSNTNLHEIWPYPGFDAAGRQKEILGIIRSFDFLEAHRATLDLRSPAHRS